MARFCNEVYFRDFGYNLDKSERDLYAYNSLVTKTDFDVFLSYNIHDIDVVKGIFFKLSSMGFKVYLDCITDPDLDRSGTDEHTARRIQERLKQSRSLIYAQSPSAAASNWMPWELGVVDGHTGKCMVLPVTRGAEQIVDRREYLLLYPQIKISDYYNDIRVFYDNESVPVSIKDFIQRR